MGINDDERRYFWAEQGGVRLGCERASMGQIKFIIDHPAGSNHATIASYRVADLCRFLETDLAKSLEANQKHIAKLMAVVDAVLDTMSIETPKKVSDALAELEKPD